MSIIPSGKRRIQMNQGLFKHESFFASDLLEKVSQTEDAALRNINQPQATPKPSNELQETMNSGRMNHDERAGQVDPRNPAPPSPQGITPVAPEDPNKSPFLTTMENPDDQEQQHSGAYETMQWVKQIVQGNGFIIDIDKSDSGTQITISPQNPEDGFDFPAWEQVVQRLGQIGVDPKKIQFQNDRATFVMDQSSGGKQVQKR